MLEFIKIPKDYLEHPKLSFKEAARLGSLKTMLDLFGTVYASNETLASFWGLNTRAVTNQITAFQKLSFIIVEYETAKKRTKRLIKASHMKPNSSKFIGTIKGDIQALGFDLACSKAACLYYSKGSEALVYKPIFGTYSTARKTLNQLVELGVIDTFKVSGNGCFEAVLTLDALDSRNELFMNAEREKPKAAFINLERKATTQQPTTTTYSDNILSWLNC